MTPRRLVPSALVCGLVIAGCASSPGGGASPHAGPHQAPAAAPPAGHADASAAHDHTPHDHGSAGHDHASPGEGPAAPAATSARSVELPTDAGAGEPREVKVLVDDASMKLVTIALRKGTPLPEHDAPVPVTIQALRGAGWVLAGGERLRLDATHVVALAPKVPHAVEPEVGTDLLLLVSHLRGGAAR